MSARIYEVGFTHEPEKESVMVYVAANDVTEAINAVTEEYPCATVFSVRKLQQIARFGW